MMRRAVARTLISQPCRVVRCCSGKGLSHAQVEKEIELSEDEIKRLVSTSKNASLPELLGEDADGVVPRAFHEEESVDMAMAFIDHVQDMDLNDVETAAIEELMDGEFEGGQTSEERFEKALACFRINTLAQDDVCMRYLAKVMFNSLYWSERRALHTLAYVHLGCPEKLQEFWRMDIPSTPTEVPAEALTFVLNGDVAATEAYLKTQPFTERFCQLVLTAAKNRHRFAVLKSAFEECSSPEGTVKVHEAEAILEKVPTLHAWKSRVAGHAKGGEIQWKPFCELAIFDE
ncbi:hypothetical protein DIPPA_14892 [Diplonema papillatum]|nr:hypothetical protein DIPPA_14892 [Diplonema papillatum]